MRLLVTLVLGITVPTIPCFAQDYPVQAGPAASPALTAQLTQLDHELFAAAFNQCEPDKLIGLIADDFEFYHDKSGLIAESGTAFIDSVRRMCAGRESGQNVAARRALVADSMQVYPLNHYGAIQTGRHLFYGINADGTETLRETAQFTHVWQQTDDRWLLTRVLSYDHQPASQ